MIKNEGKIDRILRFIIGIGALYFSFVYSLWWLALAIPSLITSFTGFCGIYKLLGINTSQKAKVKPKKKKL